MTDGEVLLDPERAGEAARELETGLGDLVVGQDEAIREIVDVYQMHTSGLGAAGRPVGVFLFLGPTGSGKTRIVEAAAEVLVGNPRALLKIDCGELQHSHEIAKLIGSPPGYLGHRETLPLLCQENLNRYHTETVKLSFVLFDEIEKASDALWNLLLGILDKATLTLGDNRRVDFSRAMIFMTSNLGAGEMQSLIRPGFGFGGSGAAPAGRLTATALEAARRKFTPEFMNRIDKTVVFRALGEPELRRVLDIELRAVQERVFADCPVPFAFSLTDAAKTHVLAAGADPRYGARHLKRAIDRLVVQPFSNLVASRQVDCGDRVWVDFDTERGRLVFSKRFEGAAPNRVAAAAHCQARESQDAAAAEPRRAVTGWTSGEIGFGE
jgi:ATP-dependent Clp protease ATP-binding subunit ClpA